MSLRRSLTYLSGFAIAFGAALTLSNAAFAQSPYPSTYYGGTVYPAAPVRPVMYDYVYYPNAQVYYAPHKRYWYWFDGYAWQSAYTLPYGLQVDFRLGGIPITLRSALPYREHHYVDSYYGRPWRARYHQEHERREWREREVWREAGRGYPRYDEPRRERYEEHRHHHW